MIQFTNLAIVMVMFVSVLAERRSEKSIPALFAQRRFRTRDYDFDYSNDNENLKKGCPPGAPEAMCSDDPCEFHSCPAHPDATCEVSTCGTCHARFYDDNKNQVNCFLPEYVSDPNEIPGYEYWKHKQNFFGNENNIFKKAFDPCTNIEPVERVPCKQYARSPQMCRYFGCCWDTTIPELPTCFTRRTDRCDLLPSQRVPCQFTDKVDELNWNQYQDCPERCCVKDKECYIPAP